jgi:peroxiredoxin
MGATLCLFSCILVTAQPAGRSEWILTPQLSRGQELTYRGWYREEVLDHRVQRSSEYHLESHVFVLDASVRGSDLAFLTTLQMKNTPDQGRTTERKYSSVRLERAKLDPQGRLLPDKAGSLAVALEGPPTIECGNFVEVPRGRGHVGQSWEMGEDGRTIHAWKVAGSEPVMGLTCVKLEGVQQSDDWDRGRADHTAWRRRDTVWLVPGQGIAQKVERVIERREPGRKDATQRSVLTYELANSARYPADLYDDRRLDITQAKDFWDSSQPLFANPASHAAQLDLLLQRINHYLQKPGPTPYREAVARVKRCVEAARRGEVFLTAQDATPAAAVAAVGKPAPDFVAPNFTSRESARLRSWFGKPILLVFYNPTSDRTAQLLRFAQSVGERAPQAITVLGMAMSEDGDSVRKQRTDLRLTFPVLCGSGLRFSYSVETTPRLVVLDAAGVVRGSYLGWGLEVQESILEDLKIRH